MIYTVYNIPFKSSANKQLPFKIVCCEIGFSKYNRETPYLFSLFIHPSLHMLHICMYDEFQFGISEYILALFLIINVCKCIWYSTFLIEPIFLTVNAEELSRN